MRLFAAVNLPAAEKDRLSAVVEELRRSLLPLRWVDSESLHITLKFFGEVNEANRADITKVMQETAASFAPFDIRLQGFGTFPPHRSARVLWLGAASSEQLVQLQKSLDKMLVPIGFPAEQREFHPHITLGRAQSNSRGASVSDVVRITRNIQYEAVVTVSSIDLMRSHLSSRGAQYERIEQLNLGSEIT